MKGHSIQYVFQLDAYRNTVAMAATRIDSALPNITAGQNALWALIDSIDLMEAGNAHDAAMFGSRYSCSWPKLRPTVTA